MKLHVWQFLKGHMRHSQTYGRGGSIMIYLGALTKRNENSTEARVGFIHRYPFDAQHGLKQTKEELEQSGVLVDELPDPKQNGKIATLYVDLATNKTRYEYIDPPASEIDRTELEKVKLQQVLLKNALDELIISSPTIEQVEAFKEKLKLMQQALDEIIVPPTEGGVANG